MSSIPLVLRSLPSPTGDGRRHEGYERINNDIPVLSIDVGWFVI